MSEETPTPEEASDAQLETVLGVDVVFCQSGEDGALTVTTKKAAHADCRFTIAAADLVAARDANGAIGVHDLIVQRYQEAAAA